MAEQTEISWTDATWSPWEGCTAISPGCKNCYAEAMNKWLREGKNWGPGAPRREYSDAHWEKPLRWNSRPLFECKACSWRGECKPSAVLLDGVPIVSCPACSGGLKVARRRVFPSVCDPFDNEVPQYLRTRLFGLIYDTPNIDWLLLTKRIGNAARMLTSDQPEGIDMGALPNLWLGATVVNQEEADRDIPKLLATPARVRFLSMEPLLGPVDLTEVQAHGELRVWVDALRGHASSMAGTGPRHDVPKVDWVIAGGESGRGARPFVLDFAKEVVRACRAAGVPVHVKQIGARPVNREGVAHQITDKAGRILAEWPEELRVQEFPEAPC